MAPRPLSLPFSASALTEIRERAGLTLVDVAKRCKNAGYTVHSSHLGKIESGKHLPSAPLLAALTTALGVTVDDLLDKTKAGAA
jgi:transcriptional regulator with XRE-family HTH domain